MEAQRPGIMKEDSGTKKVLLMGRAGSGKTSMKSIIFVNYLPRDTRALRPTASIEFNTMRFLGNLQLNLWDCGGQDVFIKNYLDAQKQTVFQNVQVLIFVIGVGTGLEIVTEVKTDYMRDIQYFAEAVTSLRAHSPKAQVFCLVHKMDLVPKRNRENIMRTYHQALNQHCPTMCFPTSIWDETLYKAWSKIVNLLVPDVDLLTRQVSFICEMCEADEVVIFEKNTFLVIAQSSRAHFQDEHRFERISNIVKQFKLCCGKTHTSFQSFQIRSSDFVATIEPFLHHSYVMVVVSDPDVPNAHTLLNLESARHHLYDLTKTGHIAFGVHL